MAAITIGITDEGGEAQEHLISGAAVIGRAEDADVVIMDGSVSRRHAEIVIDSDGEVTVTDLGSSNGTFIDGEQINGPATLGQDQSIRFGDVEVSIGVAEEGATQVLEPEDDTSEGETAVYTTEEHGAEEDPTSMMPTEDEAPAEKPFFPAPPIADSAHAVEASTPVQPERQVPPPPPRRRPPAQAPAPPAREVYEPAPEATQDPAIFNWPAVFAFVLGPLSILMAAFGTAEVFYASLPTAVLAIVLGSTGKRRVDSGRSNHLRGLALAGQVFGAVGVFVSSILIAALIVVNTLLDQSADNLDQVFNAIRDEIEGTVRDELAP